MAHAAPPLNALKAFEAAARHANFARAAAELHVTPGALSHQIRGLEALLGTRLFERRARGVVLTPQGRRLQPGLQAGFALIREAVDALRATVRPGVLVVSTPPGFTSKWLAPRLHRFAAAQPDIELRIASSAAYADFGSDGIDIAVRNLPAAELGQDAQLQHDKLVDDEMLVVCSPALAAKWGRQTDLRKAPLIHDDQLAGRPEVPTWADWFSKAGLQAPDLRRGLRFSGAEHAIEAAIQGAGLLLSHAVLVHDELARGRLVQPFATTVPAGRVYVLVWPKQRAVPGVAPFRDWMHGEMAAMLKPAARRRRPRIA